MDIRAYNHSSVDYLFNACRFNRLCIYEKAKANDSLKKRMDSEIRAYCRISTPPGLQNRAVRRPGSPSAQTFSTPFSLAQSTGLRSIQVSVDVIVAPGSTLWLCPMFSISNMKFFLPA